MIKKISILVVSLSLILLAIIVFINVDKRWKKHLKKVDNIYDNLVIAEKTIEKLEYQVKVLNSQIVFDKKYDLEKFPISFDLKKIFLDYKTVDDTQSKKTSYLLEHEDKIFIFFQSGKIAHVSTENILNGKIYLTEIKNNLYKDIISNNERFFGIKGILKIDNNELLLSYSHKENNCYTVKVLKTNLNTQNMQFENFFDPNECVDRKPKDIEYFGLYSQGGKMIKYKNNNILMSFGDYDLYKRKLAQDDNSIFGKIIELNLDTKEYKIFSKGHRNPQGLYYDEVKNKILENEHGPSGGDEINQILQNGNYGSPVVFYGRANHETKASTHQELGFIEPIKFFTPESASPSGIYKFESKNEKFLNIKTDLFLMSSLAPESLFFLKFNSDLDKLINVEKVYIEDRIRDLIYIDKFDTYVMALESTPAIGILKFN